MMMLMMMLMMRRLSSLRVRAKSRHLPYIYIYIYIAKATNFLVSWFPEFAAKMLQFSSFFACSVHSKSKKENFDPSMF